MIYAAHGVEPGVGIGMDRSNGIDGDITPNESVEPTDKRREVGHRTVKVEMRHHHAGIDTGIGSPSAYNFHRFTGHGGKRLFQHRLHAHGVGLFLPAVERRPTIGKMHEIALAVIVGHLSPFQDMCNRKAPSGNC